MPSILVSEINWLLLNYSGDMNSEIQIHLITKQILFGIQMVRPFEIFNFLFGIQMAS